MILDFKPKLKVLMEEYELVKLWALKADDAISYLQLFINKSAIDNQKFVKLINTIYYMQAIQKKTNEIDTIPDWFKYYMEDFDREISNYIFNINFDPYNKSNEPLNTSIDEMFDVVVRLQGLKY